MKDDDKTKEQLMQELVELRQRISELKALEIERKQANEISRQSENRYRLFDNASDGIFIADSQGNFVDVNTSGCTMLGFSREEILRMHIRDLIFIEDVASKPLGLDIIRSGKILMRERRFKRKDDTLVPVEISAKMLPDGRILGIVRDITERKQAEEKLKESEERWHSLVENAPDIIVISDRDGAIQFINHTVIDKSSEEVIGTNIYDYIAPEYHNVARKTIEYVFQTGSSSSYENRGTGPDGRISWYDTQIGPIKKNEQVVSVTLFITDITERKQAEKSLRESEEKYSTLVEKGNDGITIIQDGLVKFANPKLLEIVEFSLEELLEKPFIDYVSPEYKKFAIDRYKKRISRESVPNRYEMEILGKDGRKISVEINASLIEYKGKPADMGIVRDITERKQAEEALRKSEEKFRRIIENTRDCIMLTQPDAVVSYLSPASREVLGYDPEDIVGTVPWIIHPDDTKKVNDALSRALEGEGGSNLEYRIKTKEGEMKWLSHSWSPIMKGNELQVIVSVLRDNTESKRAEEALRKSEQELTIRNQIADIFLTVPDDEMYGEVLQVILDAMESKYGVFGYINENGDLVCPSMTRDIWRQCQIPDKDIIFPSEIWGGIWGRSLLEKKTIYSNDPFHVPEGHIHIIRALSVPIIYQGEVIGSLLIGNKAKDYDERGKELLESLANYIAPVLYARLQRDRQERERKQAEEALKESEERYRGLHESSMDGIIYRDMEGRILDCNQAILDMLGYTKQELYRLSFQDYVPREWHDLVEKIFREQIIPRGYSDEFEIEGTKKDGTIFPASVRAWLNKDKDGTQIGTWAIVRDITESKQAEKKIKEYAENLERLVEERTSELKESEELYKTLVKTSPDAVTVSDFGGKITEVSQRSLELYGAESTDELLGKNAFEFIAPEDREKAKINLQKTLKEGVTRNLEYTMLKKDGSRYFGELNAAVIKDASGYPKGFIATTRDITKRKKLEEMRSQFINVAAHELRTPLSALKAHIDLLKIKIGLGHLSIPKEANDRIEVIERNADRLIVLINNLLNYTRLEAGTVKVKMELGSLEAIVSQVSKEILLLAQKHKHTLNLTIPKLLPLINMDKAMVNTIFTNLLSNAIKYSPDGGAIDVTIIEEKDKIHATIKDTGIGIAEEDLEKIFQPFYVTDIPESVLNKSEFERTGLGLAITKEYVTMHRGRIWAESRSGEGCTFHVILPKKVEN